MEIWETRQTNIDNDQRKRNNFGRDRARVIHSAFFRRLQGKTQVLGLGESDFYRTRLTHSIEVSQIASGIVEYLNENTDESIQQLLPSHDLIETISLAHDIGHPPFGHGGEVALNYSMRNHGGFEGNAQTLRICTKLGEFSESAGLNLTRRTLLGLIKYPSPYSAVVNTSVYLHKLAPINIDSFKPPKCVFDCDTDSLNFILFPIDQERHKFQEAQFEAGTHQTKHKKTLHKSLDTSIMELADDIAYGVHDLEDAVALSLVSERQWNREVRDIISDPSCNYALRDKILEITKDLFSGSNKTRKKSISSLVGYFIKSCTTSKKGIFSSKLIDLQVSMNPTAKKELDILKKFVVTNVIKTAEVQTLEYKGQQMIVRLFEAIANNPSRLLPKKYFLDYEENKDLRVVCDYLAGTTDDYATRLYHKIFTPSTGSVFDRL